MNVLSIEKAISIIEATLAILPHQEFVKLGCFQLYTEINPQWTEKYDEPTFKYTDPTDAEKEFLDTCIDQDPKNPIRFKIINENAQLSPARNWRGVIAIAEQLPYHNTSLSSALATDDTETKELYAGIIQHERKHQLSNHVLKRGLCTTAVSFIAIGLVLHNFMKKNSTKEHLSIAGHFWSALKIISGSAILKIVNYEIIMRLNHTHEFDADQNIQPEIRNAVIQWYKKVADNKKTISPLKQATELFTHPPLKERMRRLQGTD